MMQARCEAREGGGSCFVLALASSILINLAYLREHDAAAELPVLSMRRPIQSARLLLGDSSWLLGFAMETGGFLLYVAALVLSNSSATHASSPTTQAS